MSKLVWDEDGSRFYEAGIDRCVLFVKNVSSGTALTYGPGVAWNGVTSVSESPDGADANDLWADNIKYGTIRSAETLAGSIEAYTYPDEWEECDGSASIASGVLIGQQTRRAFALCYRTKIGNDESSDIDKGYKLHILYGATASPSDRQYETINDSPDAITFSWDYETNPVPVTGYKPTSLVTIDSTKVSETKLSAIEDALYGSASANSRLLMPDEILSIINAA